MALAAANRVLMLEHSIYSVISPEGCAAIMWKDAQAKGDNKAPDAADAMKISAQDLAHLGVIDGIIPEPLGGSHRAPEDAMGAVKDAVCTHLDELVTMSADDLVKQRREKFIQLGRHGLDAAA